MHMLLAGRNKTNFLSYSVPYQSDGVSDNLLSKFKYQWQIKNEVKLITADGTVFPDPYALVENWKDNVKLLPDITWAAIFNYFINLPSLYKSLVISSHSRAWRSPASCMIKTVTIGSTSKLTWKIIVLKTWSNYQGAIPPEWY